MFELKIFLLFYYFVLSKSYPLEFDFDAPADIYDKITDTENNLIKGYAITLLDTLKWPNGIVPYEIDQSFSQDDISIILSGMRVIESSTRLNGRDCIKFVKKTNEINFVRIINESGCWSYVGRQQTGAQNLSLQIPSDSNPGSCLFSGTVSHELIHALGFVHEQSRPDRDLYVRINWNNMDEVYWNQFQKFSSSFGDTMGFKYDYDSILHYSSFYFSKNGLPTIVPLRQANLIMNKFNQSYLSDIDKKEIRKFYKCEEVGLAIGLASRTSNDSWKIKILAIFYLSVSNLFF